MIDFSDFSSEVFQILRAYGKDIVLYDDTGKRVFEPAEARRMYVIGDNILVSIVEDGDNSAVRLFLSPSLNLSQVQGFLETLRRLAVQSNLLFHVKKYNKEIKPKDFATSASVNEQKETSMNIMEGLYGTSKSSYLKMENARMIVRHSTRIKEHVIGDRGRHIHSIFVENAQGERFLFPVNMLSGARAMTNHVNNGGNFADEVGSQIVRMAQDFRNLAQVTTHIKNDKTLGESAETLRVAIMESMKSTKRSFARIYTEATYLGESAKVASNTNLTEGSESLSESVAALADILGPTISESALLSVARSVTIEAATAPQLDEEVDEEVDEAEELDAMEEDEEEMAEGQSIDVTVEGLQSDTPNNPQIREFEQWLESFDPDTMFGKEKVAEVQPVKEYASKGPWKVKGILGLNSPFLKCFDTAEARQDWLDTHGDSGKFEIERLIDPDFAVDNHLDAMAMQESFEGPSFIAVQCADQFYKCLDSGVAKTVAHALQSNGGDDIQIVHSDELPEAFADEIAAQARMIDARMIQQMFDPKMDDAEAYLGMLLGDEFAYDLGGMSESFSDMTEGKSYKKNDDEDQMSKKEKDQERKDAAKSKKTPVAEAQSAAQKAAFAKMIGKKKGASPAKDEKAEKEEVEEGKSFKRNDDDAEDVKGKRKDDKQKRDEKKKPVEEGKSFKKNDDDDTDADSKKKDSKQKRDEKKKTPVAEASTYRAAMDAHFKNAQDKLYGIVGLTHDSEPSADIEVTPDSTTVVLSKGEDAVKEGSSAPYESRDEVESLIRRSGLYALIDDNSTEENYGQLMQKLEDQFGEDIASFVDSQRSGDWLHYHQRLEPSVESYLSQLPQIVKLAKQQFGLSEDEEMGGGEYDQGYEAGAADAGGEQVSEDGVRFSHSFETNIQSDDGQTVSAKVTYVPNHAGAATVVSVVRGDTGEDVLDFMDDDDLIHVEGLCADDMAQQGSEQFESTTIPRDGHQDFKDDVETQGQNPGQIARMKSLAGIK